MSSAVLPMDLNVTTTAEGDLLGCNTLVYQGTPIALSDLAEKTVNQTGNSVSQTTSFQGQLSATGPIEVQNALTTGTILSSTGTITTASTLGSVGAVTLQNTLTLNPGYLAQWRNNLSNLGTLQLQQGVSATNNYAGTLTYSHTGDGNAANELQWTVLGNSKSMGLTPSTLSFPQGLSVNSETVLPTISVAPSAVSYTADPTITNSLTFTAGSTSHREINIEFALDVTSGSTAGRLYLQVGSSTAWATVYEGFTSGNYSLSTTENMNNYLTWTGLGVALCTDSMVAGTKLLGSVRFYRLNNATNMYLIWAQISCPDTKNTTTGYAKTMWASGMGSVTLDVIQRARLVSSSATFQLATTSTWNYLCA